MIAGDLEPLDETNPKSGPGPFVSEGDRAELWFQARSGRDVVVLVPGGGTGAMRLTLDSQVPRTAKVVAGAIRFPVPADPPDEPGDADSVRFLWQARIETP